MRVPFSLSSLFVALSVLIGCSETPSDTAHTPGAGTGGTAESGAGSGGTQTAGTSGTGAASGGSTSGGSANGGTTSAGVGNGGAMSGGAGAGGLSSGGAGASSGAASGGAAGSGVSGASAGGAAGTSGSTGGAASGGTGGSTNEPPSLLVFSRTAGYRHESIPAALQALNGLAEQRGWTVTATEDPAIFTDQGLEPFNVIVFLLTSDDVLDSDQEAAFERHIRAGNGFAGIHSATATEQEWPFYGELLGARFREHPDVQPATLVIEAEHPATAGLPDRWMRTDEWYSFEQNPRSSVTVLISIDETSYSPGTSSMQGDHPLAWYKVYEGSRSFQTTLGHTIESYTEALFLEHITGGIEWAAGK